MTQTYTTADGRTTTDFDAVIDSYATGTLVRMAKAGRVLRTADVRPDQVAAYEARGYRRA